MGKPLEYYEKRIAILEIVLTDLGALIATQLPSVHPHLVGLSRQWCDAMERLDAEFPESE